MQLNHILLRVISKYKTMNSFSLLIIPTPDLFFEIVSIWFVQLRFPLCVFVCLFDFFFFLDFFLMFTTISCLSVLLSIMGF